MKTQTKLKAFISAGLVATSLLACSEQAPCVCKNNKVIEDCDEISSSSDMEPSSSSVFVPPPHPNPNNCTIFSKYVIVATEATLRDKNIECADAEPDCNILAQGPAFFDKNPDTFMIYDFRDTNCKENGTSATGVFLTKYMDVVPCEDFETKNHTITFTKEYCPEM
jgi:hypothetical protein